MVADKDPRCTAMVIKHGILKPCNKKLGNSLTRPWDVDCGRCGANYHFIE